MANRLDRPPYTQEQIDDALTALIAFAGNAKGACVYLESEGKRVPVATTLKEWAQTTHWERYEELRELHAGKVESKLTHDMFDATRRATEGVVLGVEKAVEKLEKGQDQDPGKTAANLASVAQRMTDKGLALSGRPSRITESRDAAEIVRALVARHPGVFGMPDEPAQIEASIDDAGRRDDE